MAWPIWETYVPKMSMPGSTSNPADTDYTVALFFDRDSGATNRDLVLVFNRSIVDCIFRVIRSAVGSAQSTCDVAGSAVQAAGAAGVRAAPTAVAGGPTFGSVSARYLPERCPKRVLPDLLARAVAGSKADDKGRRLIEAGLELMEEVPYVEITVVMIAERASLARSLVLYYFEDKEELFRSVVRDLLDRLREVFHTDELSAARRSWQSWSLADAGVAPAR